MSTVQNAVAIARSNTRRPSRAITAALIAGPLLFLLSSLNAVFAASAKARRRRRDYEALLDQPDHLLKDIGLTRAQLLEALQRSRR